ncbi:Amphoterin-induced protein 1 AMIGO-1 Alivin-2 Precursor [Larimichthys crocea]|uniref:Amphoterin-induced protein 1 AMIGO-1 Alivin-2 n=1 Tax=Larimichthys crocea TaxID=215358 RepID=A0A6G0IPW7_LARCR|nr:Amphoterin-induced protein 1 AMIGO-1 Alivin-2 Precursor [Larimichthys crocea]
MALLWLPGAAGSALNCHKTCICASNIVSCSKMNLTTVPTSLPLYTAVLDLSYNNITRLRSEWTLVKLLKLHNLLLSHNGLHFLSSEAFVYVKYLRYLDLSSNNLRQLDEFIFEPLVNLEVLLLYNNQISQIDRSAFGTMVNLQKLYLSQNQISRFPLELVKEKSRLEKLSLLDVSSNKIKMISLDELQVLPAWIKNGLYFHNNPLLCHCDLYTLLAHWYIRKLNSAVDFKDDYTCILPGPQKTQVRVFDLSGDNMNCSTFKEADEEAFLEQTLILGCDTKHRNMLKTWMMPGNVVVTPGRNQTAKVLPDGSLQISPVRSEDSGTYTCLAMSEVFNETIYVVLKGKARGEDSIHSSMLSVTPTHEDPALKAELNRHVAFIDSKDLQGQNGKLNPNGDEDDDDLDAEAGSLMKGKRKEVSSRVHQLRLLRHSHGGLR